MDRLCVSTRDGQALQELALSGQELIIGRLPDCGLVLADRAVSRRHARIAMGRNGWYIEDLDSINGVLINDRPVLHSVLNDGDRISIGNYILQYQGCSVPDSASQSNVLLRVEDITKTYQLGEQTVTALRDVCLTVYDGEFLALAGTSGSGKSTLLNIIGTIDLPSRGSVLFHGEDMATKSIDALADFRLHTIGFIFQTFNLLPVLSARENIEYPLLQRKDIHKRGREMRVNHYLEVVGLADYADHRPNQLSGGQRQRVAIARALAGRPHVVLADEPTANLDHKTGEAVLQLMKRINEEEGTTFIFSTHDPKVMEMADRVVHIEDGILRQA
jgi:putative ABC transport system ATP-binding protein